MSSVQQLAGRDDLLPGLPEPGGADPVPGHDPAHPLQLSDTLVYTMAVTSKNSYITRGSKWSYSVRAKIRRFRHLCTVLCIATVKVRRAEGRGGEPDNKTMQVSSSVQLEGGPRGGKT